MQRSWPGAAEWLIQLGSSAPEEHCRLLVDYLDGVIFHQLAFPGPTFEPEPGIREILVCLVGP